jgi:hypothetical protein
MENTPSSPMIFSAINFKTIWTIFQPPCLPRTGQTLSCAKNGFHLRHRCGGGRYAFWIAKQGFPHRESSLNPNLFHAAICMFDAKTTIFHGLDDAKSHLKGPLQ